MNMLKKRNRKHEEENYWQSSTDMMVGLLLAILLVMSLLLLLLAHKDDHKYDQNATGVSTRQSVDQEAHFVTTHPFTNRYDDDDNGGGGGGESHTNGHIQPYDDFGKTAVLVSVVDEETGNVIKQSGILFELYANQDAVSGLQTLYTYYPTKIEYKQYQTTENGTFYLPEKIFRGWYSLHNLKAPDKYESGRNTKFEIRETRDWNDPFLVSVPLSPAKNTIKLRAVDSVTRAPVPGGVYEIVADEDIVLLDGTVRLEKGKVADVVTCDEQGYAESKRLYLGHYSIRQKEANRFYAVDNQLLRVEVKRVDKTETPVNELLCEKTEIIYTLRDTYDNKPIPGAGFMLANGTRVTTDNNGQVVLTDLTKGTTYSLTLEDLPAPYRDGKASQSFVVDARGYVNGEAKHQAEGQAYAIRLSASVADKLLRQDAEGVNLTLYDGNNQVVDSWDSNGTDRMIEGLEPGSYKLEAAGRASSRISFTVRDVDTIQKQAIYIWTLLDFILLLVAALLLAGLVVLTVSLLRRRKRKKAQQQEQQEQQEQSEGEVKADD